MPLVPGWPACFEHVACALSGEAFAAASTSFASAGFAVRPADHGIADSMYLSDPDGTTVELTTYRERERHVR